MVEWGTAQRLQRPSWRDGRLLLGLLLVVASVALGIRAVSVARQTVPVYAAAHALVPGERLAAERLTRVDVALGGAEDAYLRADRPLPAGATVVREVRPGELLPTSALLSGDRAVRIPVMVPVAADAARVLVVGSVVDVWVNEKQGPTGTATYGTPRRLLENAPVGRVPGPDEGRLTATGTLGVQVLVPAADVEKLIAAVDQGARITLVPTPGSPQRDR